MGARRMRGELYKCKFHGAVIGSLRSLDVDVTISRSGRKDRADLYDSMCLLG